MSFFAELKRRKVFRVGITYAVVAWLLIEVASTVLPTFNTPGWVLQTVTFLLILGFPVALIFAWVFDYTPEGIRVTPAAQPGPAPQPAPGQAIHYLILGLLIVMMGIIVLYWPERAPVTPQVSDQVRMADSGPVRRASLNLGETLPIPFGLIDAYITLSPDGRQLVYTASTDGTSRLYVRSLDQLTARVLPGTENAYDAFFSPDGKWVGYENINGHGLYKVPIAGGAPQQLTGQEASAPGGAFWGGDGNIYYSIGGKLHRIASAGGIPEPVPVDSGYGEWNHGWPFGLPGGTHLLLTVYQKSATAKEGDTALLSLATGDFQPLIRNGFNARYVPTGHIVFMRSGDLWAVPFDVERLRVTGPEAPVVNGIQTSGSLGAAVYAYADDGWLVYLPGKDTQFGGTRNLVWVDRAGKETPWETKVQNYFAPRLSPDGTQVAITVGNYSSGFDIWSYDLVRATLSRRTFTGDALLPLWTPDGMHIVFNTFQGLAWVPADGTGKPEPLLDTTRFLVPGGLTPDGSRLVYSSLSDQAGDLYTLSMTGERTEQVLLASEFDEYEATLSTNGHWMAYTSNETGRNEIYVRPFPAVEEGKWQISTNGGMDPRWRGDGKELYYTTQDGNGLSLLVVSIDTEPSFQPSAPAILFAGDYVTGPGAVNYDVTPDGERFLMVKEVNSSASDTDRENRQTSLVVVDNWFEELRRLAPPSD